MIAISYRREDSLPVAGRLYDRLQTEFGKGNVFMDFDSIPYGVDFREHIKQMIDQSKVLVAMIGPDWVGRRRHRGRRIDDPGDFVRIEIAYALNRKLPIIPVLVGNAQMPSPEQLPKDIEGLAFRNAITLDAGIDFHHHAERLAVAINRLLTTAAAATPPDLEKVEPPKAPAAPHIPLAPPESRIEAITPARERAPKRQATAEESPVQKKRTVQTSAENPNVRAATPQASQQKERFIDLRVQIAAVNGALTRFRQAVRSSVTSAKSGISGFFNAIGNGMQSLLQSFGQLIRHRWKVIALWAISVVALATTTATIYWGIRSGNFRLLAVQVSEFFKSKTGDKIEPMRPPDGVVRSSSESQPAASTASEPPAQTRGSVFLDSTPQGEGYEVIDSNNKHHVGKTPETLDDLPIGYAHVIFRRQGFVDHRETVWIAPNGRATVAWQFQERSQLTEPSNQSAPAPSLIPPVPLAANPAAQNGRPWQEWITAFVRQFVDANQSPDPNPTLSCYAPIVDYFGEKNRDQAYIRGDLERYNQRWPIRHDEIEGNIQLLEKVPGKQCSANFKLNFYAESSERKIWTKGQFAIDAEITSIDGVPKITAIRGKTMHQQKGVPGATPKPSVARQSYPSGIPVPGKAGIVRSPYAPSKGEIDIRRYPKGSQVKCPYTGKIFIAP